MTGFTENLSGTWKEKEAYSVLLSIVVFARKNTSSMLKRLFDSLKGQTIEELEVLVIDRNDPSDPYSLTLKEDIKNYPEFRLFPSREKDTDAACRNAILDQCRGKYVAFTEGGAWWTPEKAARQVELLEEADGAALCCCKIELWEQERSRMPLPFPGHASSEKVWETFSSGSGDPIQDLVEGRCIYAEQVVYRMEMLREAGGFLPGLNACIDLDAAIRFQEKWEILMLDEVLAAHSGFSLEDMAGTCYEAAKILQYENYDRLLQSRKLAYRYYLWLAQLCRRNKLWCSMLIHLLLAFCKRPFYSVGQGIRGAFYKVFQLEGTVLFAGLLLKEQARQKRMVRTCIKGRRRKSKDTLEWTERKHGWNRNVQEDTLQIPLNQTVIHAGEFAFTRGLRRVEIPASVERIEVCAFMECTDLEEIVFAPGSALRSIDGYAFALCQKLRSIVLPGTITSLGEYAFAFCQSLRDLNFVYYDQGNQVLDSRFPTTISKLPRGAFAMCSSLENMEFLTGSLLAALEPYVFAGCTSLAKVQMDGMITQIGSYAFAYCTSLRELHLAKVDGISSIGKGAFWSCHSLSTFHIPRALAGISNYCFYDCSSLKYIRIPKTVLFVGKKAFSHCASLETVFIARASTKYVESAFDQDTRIAVGVSGNE